MGQHRLLWFAWIMLETTMVFIARWPITYFISVVVCGDLRFPFHKKDQ